MSDGICEDLLEAHYHQPITQLFSEVLGAEFVKILKPTRQREAWVGFDKAWVRTSLTIDELYQELRCGIQSSANNISEFYFGLFLQFKVVALVKRRSKHLPSGYHVPYFRSELSLNPSKLADLSQHETLIRLNNIERTNVAYACPMIFEQKDLRPADLGRLRIVDISTAPPGWLTNESHYITFQDESGTDTRWCSEATPGRSYEYHEWVHKNPPVPLEGEEVIQLIEKSEQLLLPKKSEPPFLPRESEPPFEKPTGLFFEDRPPDNPPTSIIPQCFTIFKFRRTAV